MRPLNIVCIPGNGLLHPERRVTGAHGMVLVGERRAEERHDPVAHHLIDSALVTVDRLDHALDHRFEELLRVLRIEVSKQLHRALDISEQHRDLLPLTLEGYPRGEDLIGEVLGRVMLGRGEARIVRKRLQGMATLGAEPGRGRHPAPTVGTGQRSSTFLAELRLNSILVLALRALHYRPPRTPVRQCDF
jgi:hypothetical protein